MQSNFAVMATDDLPWKAITDKLVDTRQVSGGFSSAFKGVLDLGEYEIFIKLAADNDKSISYIAHEIKAYKFLSQKGYDYMPMLAAVDPELKGFAIEVLDHSGGWSWPKAWTKTGLEDVLLAMDSLFAVKPIDENGEVFYGVRNIDQSKSGWKIFSASRQKQKELVKRLDGKLSKGISVDDGYIQEMAHKESKFKFNKSALVHYDVRSYNCAWHKNLGAKLIDFDALGIGDPRIAYAFTLGDACGDGVDISNYINGRTDIEALEWVTGYWLAQSFRDDLHTEDMENKIRRSAAVINFLYSNKRN